MRMSIASVALIIVTTAGGLLSCGSPQQESAAAGPEISGRLEDGLRVLTLDPGATDQHLVIHRGDYVRAELSTGEPFTLEIPALDVAYTVPVPAGERAYFKVPDAGRFAFTAGAARGVIEAVEYAARGYREVSARDAAGLIASLDPFILDVRTEREFAGGHLAGAVLIPVQQIQQRVGELAGVKDRPVLVYCRSGNRSTVAAKVLVDAGFTDVINLRRGIIEWNREELPTEQ
ncbi:MAG: rhodanese-like domain-containing protein [Candidatus Krumholzibacteriia bacterium]